jgi:anti-sigma B factor antagonist
MRIPGRSPRRRPPPPPFKPGLSVDTEPFELGVTVIVAGELDIATGPRLRAALEELGAAEAVVIDLSGLTFMDSSALALLLEFARELRERDGRLAIACPEGPARLLFDVTGVADTLRLYDTRRAAQSALSAR